MLAGIDAFECTCIAMAKAAKDPRLKFLDTSLFCLPSACIYEKESLSAQGRLTHMSDDPKNGAAKH